jgi:hypothetical protein
MRHFPPALSPSGDNRVAATTDIVDVGAGPAGGEVAGVVDSRQRLLNPLSSGTRSGALAGPALLDMYKLVVIWRPIGQPRYSLTLTPALLR